MKKRKVNPRSLVNLRAPWKKGETPNPSGRNRKQPLSDRFRELAEEPMPIELIDRFNRKWKRKLLFVGDTFARACAMALALEAIFGTDGPRAAKEMREAIEGKAPQRVQLTASRAQVTLRVVYDRTDRRPAQPFTGPRAEAIIEKIQ